MLKRILLFFAVSILISITISFIMSLFGIGHYIGNGQINFRALLFFCLLWGMGGSFITLLISRPLAKWTMGVKVIDDERAYFELVSKVRGLSKKAGLTVMPEVGIYQSPDINAFATGRSKNSSLVAVSTGLLEHMKEDEIEGVLAHEIAHIANGDMVTMTLVQGIMNAFVMFLSRTIAFFITRAMKTEDEDVPVNPWIHTGIVFLLDIVLGILAMPVIAWFSRYREFRADHGGAGLAGKNKMVAALRSLQRAYPHMAAISHSDQNFKSMQISSQRGLLTIFSTHPPLELRIEELLNSSGPV